MGDREHQRSRTQHEAASSEGSERNERSLANEQRMFRAMKMVESSSTHREMFDLDPVAYLQRLGIDTAGVDTGKLGLRTETLAQLDAQPTAQYQLTMTTFTLTPPTTRITLTTMDPSRMTITATCSITVSNPSPTVTATVQTAAP